MRKRTIAIIALVAVALFLGSYFSGLLLIISPPGGYNTKSLYVDFSRPGADVSGQSYPYYYSASGPSGRGVDPSTGQIEILDSTVYLSSWKTNGVSEKPVPAMHIKYQGILWRYPQWHVYKWDGLQWARTHSFNIGPVPQPDCTAPSGICQWVGMPGGGLPYDYKSAQEGDILFPDPLPFYTGPTEGFIRVVLLAELWYYSGGAKQWGSGLLGQDDAELRKTGANFVEPAQLSAWKVGQTIPIKLNVGVSCSSKLTETGTIGSLLDREWILDIYSSGQGRVTKSFNLGCGPADGLSVDKNGNRLQYTVQEADFADTPDCRNILEVRIKNGYLNEQLDLRTLKLDAIQPAPPEFTATPNPIDVGRTLTIAVTAHEPSALINVVATYPDGSTFLRADRVSQYTFSKTVTLSGTLTISVSQEIDCLTSNPTVHTVTVNRPIGGGGGGGGAGGGLGVGIETISISGLSASFKAQIAGGIAPYTATWTFGDGMDGSGLTVSHAYAEAGTYTVDVSVRDAGGLTGFASRDVSVSTEGAGGAITDLFFTYEAEGLVVEFTPQVTGGSGLTYSWTFGDDETSTSLGPSHTYEKAGQYYVTLKVTDSSGDSKTYSKVVRVVGAGEIGLLTSFGIILAAIGAVLAGISVATRRHRLIFIPSGVALLVIGLLLFLGVF